MPFLDALRKLKKHLFPFYPLIEVSVSKANLLHNLRAYAAVLPGVKIAPVLKSNAYGHGLVEVGKIVDGENIAFIVVDSLYEATALRKARIKSEILIIGYTTLPNMEKSAAGKTAFTITSFDQLKEISGKLKKDRKFHLKIDTGMHRQGISLTDAPEAINLIKNNRHIVLEGLCSHLADADSESTDFTERQIAEWNKTAAAFKSIFPGLRYLHLSNTAGTFYGGKIDANAARLGIGLYGYNPDPKLTISLKPALAMRTIVTSLRDLPAGDKVGYNITYQASGPVKLATVPAGYFEGVDRRLSGKGFFILSGVSCPIVGRVSMNISSCDVTNVPNVKLEDPVEIIGASPKSPNSVENIARLCGTIPYEILVHIPAHLRRRVV